MSIVFNVFTGTFDFVGGIGTTTWLPPVQAESDLPTTDVDGAARVVRDEDVVYVFDSANTKWHRSRLDAGSFEAAGNAAGLSLTKVDVGDISRHEIRMHPATSTEPGGVSIAAQSFAGDKTFDDDVVITGDLDVNGTTTTIDTINLEVTDKNILINNNGNNTSAEGAGLTVERVGTDGSIVYEDSLVSKWKVGAIGAEVEVLDVSSSQDVSNKALGNSNTIVVQDANLTVQDNLDNTKQVNFELSGITSGATRVLTIPDASTVLVGDDTTQTLTNKTIDGDDNTLQDIGLPSLKTELADASKFIERDATGAVVSGKDVPVGDVVGTTDAQVLTSKTIDADLNTVSNIENEDIKAAAAIDAAKIHDGSVSNVEFGHLDGVTSSIQTQLDSKVEGPAVAVDNTIPRYDGASGSLVQASGVVVSDVDAVSGVTSLSVDNVLVDGNTISSVDVDGDLILSPNGVGQVNVDSSKIINLVDPTADQDAASKKYVDDNTSFVVGDLDEVSFNLANNQVALVDVSGVVFNNAVTRSAELQYSIVIDATADLFESGSILAIQKSGVWSVAHSINGDNSQVLFDINASGQLQYKSGNLAGFVSGLLKVRATTTSI